MGWHEEFNTYKYTQWGSDKEKAFRLAKEKILQILIENEVSLSDARFLFNCILTNIEEQNPIVMNRYSS